MTWRLHTGISTKRAKTMAERALTAKITLSLKKAYLCVSAAHNVNIITRGMLSLHLILKLKMHSMLSNLCIQIHGIALVGHEIVMMTP